jgi:hypothetical protein
MEKENRIEKEYQLNECTNKKHTKKEIEILSLHNQRKWNILS